VGDDFNGENEFIYDDDPMDCQGHGTHVAGIISAQENPFHFTGAAPGVELGAYRVFGCHGGTSDDAVIAAFNQAYEDGADIITASLGGPRGWAESAPALAISRIVDQGVPCLVAVGNSGSEGIFFPGGPADGKGVTAIASFDNIEAFSLVNISSYSVNESGNYQFGSSHAAPDGWNGVKLPLVAPSHDFNDNFGCEPYHNATDLSGHIVLLSSGRCLAKEKAGFAAAAGAEYIMMYSLDLGLTTINVPEVDGIKALAITTRDTGKEWMNLLKIGSKVTIDMGQTSDNNMILNKSPNTVTGGAVSAFSSWGPNWDMISKPQFGAPGSSILSTYPLSMGGYAIFRGTSMACPLAAGIFALISEVRGTLEPSVLENILSSTSKPQLFHNGTSYHDILAPVPQQGAGIIQAYDAAHAQVVLSPSSLSFNDTDHFLGALNFTIANTGSEDIQLDITHVPALTVYTPKVKTLDGGFPNEFTTKHSSLDFSESTVRVLSGENVTIEVLPTPPEDLPTEKLPVWSGYILLTVNNATVLSLPYLGLSGSLHGSTVLGQHSGTIFHTDGKQNTIVPENTTFVLPKPGKVYGQDEAAALSATLPHLMHNLTLGSPELHAEVVPVAIQRLDSTALGVPRNGSIGQVSGFPKLWQSRQVETVPWSGGLSDGTYTPPGTYKIVYRALKIFGERQKRNDWEVAESQVFSIEYDS
jgi:subtilisin family serine protease